MEKTYKTSNGYFFTIKNSIYKDVHKYITLIHLEHVKTMDSGMLKNIQVFFNQH